MPSILDELRAANAGTPAGPGPQAAAVHRETPPSAAESTTTPPALQPSRPCSCGFATFWIDTHGTWHCEACQPPRFAFQARRRITIHPAASSDGSGNQNPNQNFQATEISEADEKRYEKFIEIRGVDGRLHLVHRDCLDPRSDYFDATICKKISLGVEAADFENFAVGNFLSEILARDGQIDKLPGPWPQNKSDRESEENFLASQEDENANLKNKNSRGGKTGGRKSNYGQARGGRRR